MAGDPVHRVVVATKNLGKLAEIRATLMFPGWEFVTAEDLGAEAPAVVEDGETFTDNALIKAFAYRQAFGLAALADDSGLVVDALDGEPGVRSARYSGEGATDASNNKKLLTALQGVSDAERTARFQCAMVYVDERSMPTAACGSCARGSRRAHDGRARPGREECDQPQGQGVARAAGRALRSGVGAAPAPGELRHPRETPRCRARGPSLYWCTPLSRGRAGETGVGPWRSLVAHLLWEQGVAGSNPAGPTNLRA
jgi:XTP/dITP diphosphohydrolase